MTAIPVFQDDGGKKTDMDKLLKKEKINKVVMLRYCHRLLCEGHRNRCGSSGIQSDRDQEFRARGVAPDTSQKAIEEMKAKGIVVLEDLDLEKIKSN